MTRFDSFVAIDLETTGLDPAKCEIIELGAVRYESGRKIETFSQLVKPADSIPSEITRLTGISDQMVRSAPGISSVFENFEKFIDSSPWIIGHNIPFDLSFLKVHQDKKRVLALEGRAMDTAVLARILFPRLQRYSLNSLVELFSIKRETAHRALSDSLATAEIYLLLIRRLSSLPVSNREIVGRVLFGADKIDLYRQSLEDIEVVQTTAFAISGAVLGDGDNAEPLDEYPDNVIGEYPDDRYGDYIFLDTAAVENHFLPGGLLSKAIPGYEFRPQQAEMAVNAAEAFNRSEILLVEAPTGVGKSLGYLLPASWWASLNKEQVIISTQTKNLQSQLFYKDIPQIQKAVGYSFRTVLLKGRGNYICLYKFHEILAEAETTFGKRDREALGALLIWIENTRTGDIAECHGFSPSGNFYLWNRISCEGNFCLGPTCKFAEKCFLLKIKKEAQRAQVVVTNHHLTFADFASGGDLVRESGRIVFDEAHNLEKVAASYLGGRLDKRTLDSLLSSMFASRPTQSGFLISLKHAILMKDPDDDIVTYIESVIDSVISASAASDLFFGKLSKTQLIRGGNENSREISYGPSDNPCEIPERDEFILALKNLYERLTRLIDEIRETESIAKKRDAVIRLESFGSDLSGITLLASDLLNASDQEFVYWIERPSSERYSPKLLSAPLEVGKLLDEKFYDYLKTGIFTSATLAVDRKFEFIKSRLGLDLGHNERTLTVSLDSPFDIDSAVAVVSAGYLPSPKTPEFEQAAIESLKDIITAGALKTMVLFTSHNSLKSAAEICAETFKSAGITLFAQDGSYNSEKILKRFKLSKRAVLFGTDSFWEGVDLPGDFLQLLILHKLPFTVPDRPWFKANLKKIEEDGASSFARLSLPDAVVKFRQGFGRLIRGSLDRGCVVVLDSRIQKNSFGRIFLNSINGKKFRAESSDDIAELIREWLGNNGQ